MSLRIDTQQHGGPTVLVLHGDLDLATAPTLREAIVEVLADSPKLVVDLEAVGFVDSVGMGILLGGLKRARSAGGTLCLVCTSRTVLRPFELTGLDRVLDIHASRESALEAAGGASPLLGADAS